MYLREVRKIVERGWTKHKMYDQERQNFCLLGAFSRVGRGQNGIVFNDVQIVRKVIQQNTRYAQIVSFNDAKETTKEDILLMLDKAIAETGEL